MTNEERAAKIKEIMKDQDMTKARLSRRTTVHLNTIRNILDGKDVKISTLHVVAEALNIDPSILI